MEISKQAEEMTKENSLTAEQNQAYINIVGIEYAKSDEAEEAYNGEFSSDEDFAQNMMDKFIVRILTTENKKEILSLNDDELEHLKNELAGYNVPVHEYKTRSRKIITDLEIQSIIN